MFFSTKAVLNYCYSMLCCSSMFQAAGGWAMFLNLGFGSNPPDEKKTSMWI